MGMPHGAMPFANVLSTPAVESYVYFPQKNGLFFFLSLFLST